MKHRQTLELENVRHSAPIPMGARVGNLIFSSGIMGQDPRTGELPSDPRLQAQYCFENVEAMLAKAGASMDDLGRLTVFIKDNSMREHVNEFWLQHFPDEWDRPARHTLVYDLPAGMLVQLEVFAVLASSPSV